ncbi:LysR family transcriptional regulator [Bordetella sp. LUAb4]|uniref:LysR family transcriptional regulator n=1 Tax=Bordetella sp. LUAb4 TaxID=2843195 RepID=UPI001E2F8288|nr:LysR family transcriptional regulator [Bordetella sp. LUAb4]
MDLHLNDIALYVEVARRKNFSRAAEVLNMPASTLSRRVGELEKHVGMRLLNRSTRRIDLTEAGQIYYERCRHLVERARVAHEQLTDMASAPKGMLRVSMQSSLAHLFLPVAMAEFTRAYPNIECEFDVSSAPIDPISNPYDVVLRFGKQPDSGLIARQLLSMSCEMYAMPAYLEQHGVPRTPQDLTGHECLRSLIDERHSTWELRRGKEVEVVQVSGHMSANQSSLLYRLAVSGLGIVALPVFDRLRQAVRESGLVRVLPEWQLAPLPLYALLPSRVLPAKTQAFLSFIEPRLNLGLSLAADPDEKSREQDVLAARGNEGSNALLETLIPVDHR